MKGEGRGRMRLGPWAVGRLCAGWREAGGRRQSTAEDASVFRTFGSGCHSFGVLRVEPRSVIGTAQGACRGEGGAVGQRPICSAHWIKT